jgi:hypothetical protein
MATYTATISADGTVAVCNVHKPNGLDFWRASVYITGAGGNNFGSGTVTLQSSPDGGTTKVTMKNLSGTTYSATSNDSVNLSLGSGATNSDAIKVYAVMTGSTNPSVTVTVKDNLG